MMWGMSEHGGGADMTPQHSIPRSRLADYAEMAGTPEASDSADRPTPEGTTSEEPAPDPGATPAPESPALEGRTPEGPEPESPIPRVDDVPTVYRAIAEQGWFVDESGACLLSALKAGHTGKRADAFEDVVHFEATVNGRGMMDFDLPASGPDRQRLLLRRSLAYACLALHIAPIDSPHPILGYVSLSEGGLSGNTLTANVTFCTSRPDLPPYVDDIDACSEEALLELSRADIVCLLKG
jgi:hypothetical protein